MKNEIKSTEAAAGEPVAYVGWGGEDKPKTLLLRDEDLPVGTALYAGKPIYETYTGQNGWLAVSKDEYERTKDKYEHRIRYTAPPAASTEAAGEPIPGSPAFALRGLYKPAMEYFIDGKPCPPDEYIAWQAGIIEAVTKAKLPDPKYYGGSAEEGDQHEVKCAYVDGWNDCRSSILTAPPPANRFTDVQIEAINQAIQLALNYGSAWTVNTLINLLRTFSGTASGQKLTDEQRRNAAKAIVETYLGFPAPDREPCDLDLKAVDAAFGTLLSSATASDKEGA
jgi:hypothetical protein